MRLRLHVTGPVRVSGAMLHFYLLAEGERIVDGGMVRRNTAVNWGKQILRALRKEPDELVISWGPLPDRRHRSTGHGNSSLIFDRVFERAEDGSIGGRREGVWSSVSDACLDCGTTSKKHEGYGRCLNCYRRWKYRNDSSYRERVKKRQKSYSVRHAERNWARDRKRAKTPERREAHRKASAAWADRNSPWPRGTKVWHELIPGTWVSGVILDKKTQLACVEFRTGRAWISYRQLRRSDPLAVAA